MMSKPPLVVESIGARGYSLLLAVLITSTVLAGATALANIVISGIRQTREVTNAIQAYTEAESRMEKALYLLRKTQSPFNDIKNQIPDVELAELSGPHFLTIKENDFAALKVSGNGIVSPVITEWAPAAGCASSWIEVTTIAWDNGSFEQNRTVHSQGSSSLPLSFSFPQGTPLEMRIRALYCDIPRITVNGIPGIIKVVAKGASGSATQHLEAKILREPPLAGVFDFVLFSEENLEKL